MAATLPTSTPARLIAGDTWEWKISLADYPASTWTLRYYLVKADTQIELVGGQYESSDDHHIDIAKADTASKAAGTYSFQAFVSDGTDRKLVETGTIVVKPDFAQQGSGYDDRTHEKKVLDALESLIESSAFRPHIEYQIAGRAMKFESLSELMNVCDKYRAKVHAQERRKAGKSALGAVKVVFK